MLRIIGAAVLASASSPGSAAAAAAGLSPEHLCAEPPPAAPGERAVCSGLTRGSAPSGACGRGGGGPVIRKARACS